MKKTVILIVILIVICVLGIATYNTILNMQNTNVNEKEVENPINKIAQNTAIVDDKDDEDETDEVEIDTLLTCDEPITQDSSWCGIFQLIWNDLKNDLAKQDIIFNVQPKVVDNLNKCSFTVDDISEDNYYKTYGSPTYALKKEIEDAIKEKFNEESDILDNFEWQEKESKDYFLYGMLKKDLQFDVVFEELENGKFGQYDDVEYFGALAKDKNIKSQVRALYYDSQDSFAILIATQNDELIICKGNENNTFNSIYDDIMKRAEEYRGSRSLDNELDEIKIPNLKIDEKKEFKELENKPFYFSNGEEYEITQTLQTIKFQLDKSGVKLKSEAGMLAAVTSLPIVSEKPEPRYFYVDDTFTIFLKEIDKEKPYFAAYVDDITKFQ